MPLLDDVGELFQTMAIFLVFVGIVLLFLWTFRWLLLNRNLKLDQEHRLPRQLTMVGLSVIGIVAIVLALPVPNATRNQLLTLLGLLGSGIIALSSTTIVANAMAGLMLRATKSFRTGDFVRVGEHFGRVTERGMLDTEIQTEDRELTTLPNLYLISHPVTVVRSSGTLVSANLSLGYDVHHSRIETLLLEAANKAELEEPFVRVLELGNYAVTYRVSGFLADIKNLLTARSNLCKQVLDSLHGQGIEIVSPSFMNQRQMPPDGRMIPSSAGEYTPNGDQSAPEDIMFDKAERAERIGKLQVRLRSEITELEEHLAKAEGEERTRCEEKLAGRRKKLAALTNLPPVAPEKSKA